MDKYWCMHVSYQSLLMDTADQNINSGIFVDIYPQFTFKNLSVTCCWFLRLVAKSLKANEKSKMLKLKRVRTGEF